MKLLLILVSAFLLFSCLSSPESSLKNIDFEKIGIAVDEKDPQKSRDILAEQIDSVGRLCESLKAPKIEIRHVEAVDVYRRLEFMMALGGFCRIREMLDNGTIRNISDKDKEEIKYICQKLVFDAENIQKDQ